MAKEVLFLATAARMTREMAEADLFMTSLVVAGGILCRASSYRIFANRKEKMRDRRWRVSVILFALLDMSMGIIGVMDLTNDLSLLQK